MSSEQQYIELYEQCRDMICRHAPAPMNDLREQAFADFRRLGFPSRKEERYKYTDLQRLFEPNYGINLNRLQIPADPYQAFRCDVPNLSTSLYFVVNDMFFHDERNVSPRLPEGVVVGSMQEHVSLLAPYYGRLAQTADDGVTALNTMLAQDGLLVYVPRGVVLDRALQVINILKAPARLP